MTDSPDASSSLVIADLAADDPAWRRLTHSAVGATPVPDANSATRRRHEAMVAGALLDELAARRRSVTRRL